MASSRRTQVLALFVVASLALQAVAQSTRPAVINTLAAGNLAIYDSFIGGDATTQNFVAASAFTLAVDTTVREVTVDLRGGAASDVYEFLICPATSGDIDMNQAPAEAELSSGSVPDLDSDDCWVADLLTTVAGGFDGEVSLEGDALDDGTLVLTGGTKYFLVGRRSSTSAVTSGGVFWRQSYDASPDSVGSAQLHGDRIKQMDGVWTKDVADTRYDQDSTPELIFGSGNLNGAFTTIRTDGIELSLRGKLRFNDMNIPENTFNSNGDGTYSFDAGLPPTGFGWQPGSTSTAKWSFEWSINTDFDGSSGLKLDDLVFSMDLDYDPSGSTNFFRPGTEFFSFDNINGPNPKDDTFYWDHAIGNSSTPNGGGTNAVDAAEYALLRGTSTVAANSWNFEFYDSAEDGFEFDGRVTGVYDVRMRAFDKDTLTTVARVTIVFEIEEDSQPRAVFEHDSAVGRFTIKRWPTCSEAYTTCDACDGDAFTVGNCVWCGGDIATCFDSTVDDGHDTCAADGGIPFADHGSCTAVEDAAGRINNNGASDDSAGGLTATSGGQVALAFIIVAASAVVLIPLAIVAFITRCCGVCGKKKDDKDETNNEAPVMSSRDPESARKASSKGRMASGKGESTRVVDSSYSYSGDNKTSARSTSYAGTTATSYATSTGASLGSLGTSTGASTGTSTGASFGTSTGASTGVSLGTSTGASLPETSGYYSYAETSAASSASSSS